jgi:hypothetical protein
MSQESRRIIRCEICQEITHYRMEDGHQISVLFPRCHCPPKRTVITLKFHRDHDAEIYRELRKLPNMEILRNKTLDPLSIGLVVVETSEEEISFENASLFPGDVLDKIEAELVEEDWRERLRGKV